MEKELMDFRERVILVTGAASGIGQALCRQLGSAGARLGLPGTSKWNKIEHRLFSYITSNWRGQPLVSHATIVNLIASTTTKKGLVVQAALDTNVYETGIKVSNEEMAKLRLTPCDFHGEWNYTIAPRNKGN
jgi:Rhodopirellula transposase DDE domain